MKTDFKSMHKLIQDADTVAIACHIRPDGDSIGSSLALRRALLNMGKSKVDVYADDIIPDCFTYLEGFDQIKDRTVWDENQEIPEYDLFVIVDSSTEDRIGRCARLRQSSKKVLVIDHHTKTFIEGDAVVSNAKHAAVGAMLYEFFTLHKIEITRDIASALYTSIATDTGCFMQANTSGFTHTAAAALIETGIDLEKINYINFRLYNRKVIPGLSYALRHIKFFSNGEIAYIFMSHKAIKKYNLEGELHQFKKYASEASGVRIGVIMAERKKGEYNVSLRSHGNADMAKVAESFGGGGHKNAAGFTLSGKYKKIFNEIIARLEQSLVEAQQSKQALS